MKIAIIGYSGSGKSSLAAFLGGFYNVDVLYMDSLHFLPGWIERDTQEEKDMMNEFLQSHSQWVIDGNYGHLSYWQRMEEADQIIFMNFNRFVCLYRVMKRLFRYRGKTRESITQGCIEKIDFEFIRWILYDGRTSKLKKGYQEVIEKYSDKMIVIKNQKQLNAFKSTTESK